MSPIMEPGCRRSKYLDCINYETSIDSGQNWKARLLKDANVQLAGFVCHSYQSPSSKDSGSEVIKGIFRVKTIYFGLLCMLYRIGVILCVSHPALRQWRTRPSATLPLRLHAQFFIPAVL